MIKIKSALKILTLPDGTVKQNRRVLLDDLSGRRIEYTVHPASVVSVTEYKPSRGGLKCLSVHAAVKNCAARLMREWTQAQNELKGK